jgi:signal peptidase
MEPTLKVGDLVVIKGVEPRYISNGSIIVFYVSNHYGEDAYRIVHRVITIFEVNGQHYFETKGDNNPVSDFYRWQYIPESHVIGVVIYRLPYLGYLPLLIRQPIGIAFILLIAAALILLEVTDTNRTKKGKESLKQINLVKKEMNK